MAVTIADNLGNPIDINNPLPILDISNGVTVLNSPSSAVTATGNSVDLNVGNYSELAIDVNISAVAGTSPTYVLSVNRKGVDGVYYPIYTGSSQSAVGKISISLGVGASTNAAFGNIIQLVETVGGTTPSFTRSISIIGK